MNFKDFLLRTAEFFGIIIMGFDTYLDNTGASHSMNSAMSFNDVPIDRHEIPQSDLNIDEKVRSNIFSWNGQFSPQFVEALLNKYAKQEYTVVDPFAGSGTVMGECARKGIKAFGVELNASAYFMAKTYELANMTRIERKAVLARIEGLINSICNREVEKAFTMPTEESDIVQTIVAEINSSTDSVYKNILSTIIILLDIYNNNVTCELLLKKWASLKTIIQSIPESGQPIMVMMGDSRKTCLPNGCVDLLITSPPYINVFNYHQKYRRSVEALGFNVLSIAKSEFGSNRKNRGNRLLTVIQYCIDMALSIKEASRICRDEARMVYVVGRESSVLGYSFCNSELIFDICNEIFGLSFMLRQERVFKNRFGQMIYEDILHFSNHYDSSSSDQEIIELARAIAIKSIAKKLELTECSKNRAFLIEAIEKQNDVIPSEVIA